MYLRKKTSYLSCSSFFGSCSAEIHLLQVLAFFDSPDYGTLKKQAYQFIICTLHTVFYYKTHPIDG